MEKETIESKAENFLKYFSIELANTEMKKSEGYRLRYHVYCEEFKYKADLNISDKQEIDEFDKHSMHCLIRHNNGTLAGCIRLISAGDDQLGQSLQVEKFCSNSLDHDWKEWSNLKRGTVAEISRFSVAPDFRRRSGEVLTRFGELSAFDYQAENMRTFSPVALGCILAAVAMTELTERKNVFAILEPVLARLLKTLGMDFQKVGSDINLNGIRAPYFITTDTVMQNMPSELCELYEGIYTQMKVELT